MSDQPLTDDDLALFFLIHRAIATDLAAFAQAMAGVDPADRVRLTQLQRWMSFIARAITTHHEGEDRWLFPLVSGRDPAFAAARGELEADHQRLDPTLHQISTRLEGLSAGARLERDALGALAQELSEHMRDHLAREEAVLAPAMRQHVRHHEVKRYEEEGAKTTPLRELALLLPWVAAGATPRELALLHAILPWPVRLLERWWWRPSYERLARSLRAGEMAAAR